jgi:hypothetical protein
LIEVVTDTIATQTWSHFGGPGTICEYGGLLAQVKEFGCHFLDFDVPSERKFNVDGA